MHSKSTGWLLISLVVAFSGTLMSLAALNELRVGSALFRIPAPDGFAPVTLDMTNLTAILDRNTATAGKRLISFIPQASLPQARAGRMEYDRSFHIHIARDMIEPSVTRQWFAEYKIKTRALLVELTKNQQAQLPAELKSIENVLKELDDRDTELGLSSVTFPPHQDSDRVFAYSGLTRSDADAPAAKPQTTANTVAAVFVNDKVIMVLASGGKYDLAWTRTACSNWTAAILAANGASKAVRAAQAEEPARRGPTGKRPGELDITPR